MTARKKHHKKRETAPRPGESLSGALFRVFAFLCSVLPVFMRLRISLFLSGRDGHAEEEHAEDEEDGDGSHAVVQMTGQLGDQAHDGGSHDGSALAADVQEAKVLAGFFGGNDLCEVGSGQSLDAALEHAYADGQDPELPFAGQEEGEAGDAEVGGDAYGDQFLGGKLSGEASHDQGTGEGYELGDQEGQEQIRGVEAQGRSVGSGHVDDGIYAVDIEKEGQEEEEDLPVPDHFLKGMAQGGKKILLMGGALQEMDLFIGTEQGHAHQDPPEGHDDKGNGHGLSLGHADLSGLKDQDQADDKGGAAADVAPGIAAGGDGIHPLFTGNVAKHGVIDDKAELVADTGDDKDDQEGDPAFCQAHGQAAGGAQSDHAHKNGLFAAFPVADAAQDGPHDGYGQGGKGNGIAPVGQVVHGGYPFRLRQGVEEDGDQRGDHQGEGRIGHVIKDPVPFQFRESEFTVHEKIPLILCQIFMESKVRSKRASQSRVPSAISEKAVISSAAAGMAALYFSRRRVLVSWHLGSASSMIMCSISFPRGSKTLKKFVRAFLLTGSGARSRSL